MTTKWLNKLDEQKLVGNELFDGSEIVWARKSETDGNSSIELIYLKEGNGYESLYNRFVDFFKTKCETEIGNHVEKFLTENEYEIDEYMNYFEYDPSHPAQSFFSYAQDKGIDIAYVKVDNDFGHVANVLGTSISSLEEFQPVFSKGFVSLLSNYFFQPYFCEAEINRLEGRKAQLEEVAKNQTIKERIENQTDRKIVHCLNSIQGYVEELSFYNQKNAEKELKSTTDFLNRIDEKYGLNQ